MSDTTDPTTELLRVDGLAKSFGSVDVLEDISFALDAGTVTAIIGPNGAGKTTLLRILIGGLSPDAGSIHTTHAHHADHAVRYLPQHPQFRSGFTVEETLRFYAALLPDEVDVQPTIETVGLTAVTDRPVEALSGGMVRLLGVAQAMLGEPDLVVLDEPTGDLDPRMTEHIFETIMTLGTPETAILLATHDLTGAVRADQVVVLDRGRIIQAGSPATLMADTDTESLHEAFLATIASDEQLTVRIRGDTGESVTGSAVETTEAKPASDNEPEAIQPDDHEGGRSR